MSDCPHRRTYRTRRGVIRCSECRAVLDRPAADVVLRLVDDLPPEPDRPTAESLAVYRATILARTLAQHPRAADPRHSVFLSAYVDAAARADAIRDNLDAYGVDGEHGGVRSPALSAARLCRAQAVELYERLLTRLDEAPTGGLPGRNWFRNFLDGTGFPPSGPGGYPILDDLRAAVTLILDSDDEHERDRAAVAVGYIAAGTHMFTPEDELPWETRGDGTRLRADYPGSILAAERAELARLDPDRREMVQKMALMFDAAKDPEVRAGFVAAIEERVAAT